MNILPFELDKGLGWRANLGLVVLQADETLEMDMRRFVHQDGVGIYQTRIPSGAEVTHETLSAMRNDLTAAVALLPPEIAFDVIGYGCTSASAVLGEQTVSDLVRQQQPSAQVTNPATAAIAALRALQAQRVAILTPYIEAVSATLRQTLELAGIQVVSLASFNEANDTRVARMTEASIHRAILATAQLEPCDAVFVACTNLRAAAVIDQAEAELGIPVISSNQALAWHMFELASIDSDNAERGFGRLWRQSVRDDG